MTATVVSPFATALEDVLFDVPYCSATQFHEYYGQGPLPRRLGTGCAWVTEDGFPLRRSASGEPMPSKLRLSWIPASGGLHSEYSRFSPRLGRYITFRAFTFRPGSTLPAFPPPRGLVRRLLPHAEQNNLSIRGIDRNSGRMRELVLPFDGRHREQLADARCLITKDNQGTVSRAGTDEFQRDLTDIGAAVSGSPDELTGCLLGAAETYARMAPEDVAALEYSVEDE
ncbi:hypothetical protein LWC34_12495 [Kibdelosporangium philippinense]|uniref:Uncharacterized protein n=1 Tax=Kibdelosporangium philippinense TaxID=211113 RepID=A0ABS8Z964_9PSEU|nr:hypothetical protein [Kibdelosporangium philippinense]MCE7003639.1 hypothetical protein [Kibdelosporangium philippinense]